MFRFRQFTIEQDLCAMKVGTDGVLLGAWAGVPLPGGTAGEETPVRVLDVGTGTGLIALMMAQRYPSALLTAIDIDGDAVRQAASNVSLSPFAGRVEVLQQAVQQMAGTGQWQAAFDAVVSNPPFFAGDMKAPDRQRATARHADQLSYGELMEAAWHMLKDEGELSVVVPFDYRRKMEDEAVFRGFFPRRVCAVHTVDGKPARRYLLAFRKHPCQRDFESITLGDATYKQLTRDFYL